MSRERRLGRGLEALLGRAWDEDAQPSTTADSAASESPLDARMSRDSNGQTWLNCDAIERNPYQPRQTFDEAEIADLADSIRTHGILQPLIVRRTGDGFELVAGERRLRAALAADWKQVPVQIRDVDDRQMAELAIVENVQRKDLNAIEKAESFQRYIDQYQCTQEELASRVQIDRSTVANLIRLLELPADVKRMVQEGDISQGHARALLPLGDEQEQIDFARRIKKEGLSVRATEQGVQDRIQLARRRPAADRRRRWQFAAGRQSAQRANRISRTGAQQRSGHEGRSVANGQRSRANHDPFQKPRRILAIAANSDCETSTDGTLDRTQCR